MLITYVRFSEECKLNKKCENCKYYKPSLMYKQKMYCSVNKMHTDKETEISYEK